MAGHSLVTTFKKRLCTVATEVSLDRDLPVGRFRVGRCLRNKIYEL